jgi:transposase
MRTLVRIREGSRERSPRAEGYVPVEHPLRRVRAVIDAPLGALHQWLRDVAAPGGRCPIGPEQMVRALLLQFLFVIRRDRQLIDQIWCSVLFRWFVGVGLDEPKWEVEVFSKYRLQMLNKDIVRRVLVRGLAQAHREGLLSSQALAARQSELAQYTSDVAAGVGRPGVLPSPGSTSAAAGECDGVYGTGCAHRMAAGG